MKKTGKDILFQIYSSHEALILTAFCMWMTFAVLKSLEVSGGAALICALIIAVPVLASAFLIKGPISLFIGRAVLFLSALLLCVRSVHGKKTEFYVFVAAAVFMTVVGVYCCRSLKDIHSFGDSKALSILFVICAALVFAVFNSAVTVSRYLAYRAPGFDFGIFAQTFYSLKEHFLPLNTCERGYELSHFAVHLSPVFYLALPIYALFPRPETVQVIQAVALTLGVIPLWLTAKHLGISSKVSALFCAVYLFHPALMGGCMYDFHENCFLPVMILWTVYFAERNKLVPSLIFALLTCSVKEDAAVYIAFIGIYLLFSGKRKVVGASVTVLSVAYFIIACAYLNAKGLGVMTWRYSHLSADGSLTGVILAALDDPFRVIKESLTAERLQFALMMLLPLGLLPFFTKKISRYILFGGLLLVNLMPNWPYQYSLDFQYVFGPLALLIYAAMLNYAELGATVRRSLATFACTACVLAASMRVPTQSAYIKYLETDAKTIAVLDEAMSYIPEDATVSASPFLVAHLANRDVLYEISNTYKIEEQTDYAVIDMRYAESEPYPAKYKILGYTVVFEVEDIVCIMKKD